MDRGMDMGPGAGKILACTLLLGLLAGCAGFGYKFADGLSADARGMVVGFAQTTALVVVLLMVIGLIGTVAFLLARRQDQRATHGGPPQANVFYQFQPPAEMGGQLPYQQTWGDYGMMGPPPAIPAQRSITMIGDE